MTGSVSRAPLPQEQEFTLVSAELQEPLVAPCRTLRPGGQIAPAGAGPRWAGGLLRIGAAGLLRPPGWTPGLPGLRAAPGLREHLGTCMTASSTSWGEKSRATQPAPWPEDLQKWTQPANHGQYQVVQSMQSLPRDELVGQIASCLLTPGMQQQQHAVDAQVLLLHRCQPLLHGWLHFQGGALQRSVTLLRCASSQNPSRKQSARQTGVVTPFRRGSQIVLERPGRPACPRLHRW